MHATIENRELAARLDGVMESAISRKTIVGAVLIVTRNGEVLYRKAAGLADREAGRKVEVDAIFRMASCTKSLVAATALAMVDTGLLGLNDSVTDHLPYFTPTTADGKAAKVLVRHLMTHTSGMAYDREGIAAIGASSGGAGAIIPLEENIRRLGTLPLKFAPGTNWLYSTAIDVLGCIVATINKSTLDEAVWRYVGAPLGMTDTRFFVTDVKRLAVPYAEGKDEPFRMGDPHFVPARNGVGGNTFVPSRIFNPQVPQSGGSGMAGTAGDFHKFLEMVRIDGASVLKPETVAMAMRNQIAEVKRVDDPGRSFGFFGSVLDDPAAAKSPQGRGTVAWGGVWGHTWFLDPVAGICVTSYCNTAVEGGPYHVDVRNAIYGV